MTYRLVPMAEVSKPQTGRFMVYVDYHWPVTNEGELIFYQFGNRHQGLGSPQCNARADIARKVAENYPMETTVMQLPVIFIPLGMDD
jgi:hypothetical protein